MVPVDAPNNQRKPWSQVSHTFVDERGKELSLTTAQVLIAATILDRGYAYDDLPASVMIASNATPPIPTGAAQAPTPPATTPRVRTLASGGALEVNGGAAVVTLQPTSAAAAPAPGAAPEAAVRERVLVLKDIAAPAGGDGLYGVYVNLPPGEQPTPNSPSFVGTINTFTAQAVGRGHAHSDVEQRLPLTEALSRQQWREGDPVKITVAPIELDNRLAAPAPAAPTAAAPPPGPALRIGGMDVLGY